ncbi:hypothetical protein [Paraburkholderia sp. MM6662-R1]|uniref:hypothetical protein n=1 Tax=Paraburkholderia sp. MM6662-R1 TaxID=2991066 RepID=UPI003D1C3130
MMLVDVLGRMTASCPHWSITTSRPLVWVRCSGAAHVLSAGSWAQCSPRRFSPPVNEAKACEIILAMAGIEAIADVAGLMVAPVLYAYVKNELKRAALLVATRKTKSRRTAAFAMASSSVRLPSMRQAGHAPARGR